MLNVKQLRERLGGVDGELPVKVVINDDKGCDVDFAFYSLAYHSFVLKLTVDDDGYYYIEDEYCFFIKHTESELSIPIPKELESYYIVSVEAIKSMVDYLNKKNSNIIFEMEDDLKKIINKIK